MKTETIPVGALVHSDEIYPRGNIDDWNVAKLRRILRDGGTIDPITADRKTSTIVDGTHRARAYVLEFGAEHEIAVRWVACKNAKEMGLLAYELNNRHGKPLDSYDQATWVSRMKRLGASEKELLKAMGVSVSTYEGLMRRKTSPSTDTPIRRDVSHLAGKRLNRAQRRGIEEGGPWTGHPQLRTIRSLVHLLEADLIDGGREEVVSALRDLMAALKGWFKRDK